MSVYCEQDHAYVDEEECWDCENADCPKHPEYEDPDAKARLERFRSSEFADDVMKRASAVFQISEADAAKHLDYAFKQMQSECDTAMKLVIGDAMRAYATRYFDVNLKAVLDEMLNEAVEKKILVLEKDDTPIVTSIRKMALEKIKSFMAGLGNDNRNSRSNATDPLDAIISRVVADKVADALAELKSEAIEKFNKEAMKKMMAGMAGAIQDDKRLLTMLCD